MVLALYQNVYRGSSLKNRVLPVTDGLTLTRFAVSGEELRPLTRVGPNAHGYVIDGTVMRVWLPLLILAQRAEKQRAEMSGVSAINSCTDAFCF